jgi:hypothetical protein
VTQVEQLGVLLHEAGLPANAGPAPARVTTADATIAKRPAAREKEVPAAQVRLARPPIANEAILTRPAP